MDCAHARELLHRSLDGVPADSAFREHLTVCRECRTELTELRRTTQLLGGLPVVAAPPDFLAGVMAAVHDRHLARSTHTRWHRMVTAVAAAAAIIGLVLVGQSVPGLEAATARQASPVDILGELAMAPAELADTETLAATDDSSDLVLYAQDTAARVQDAGNFLLGLCFLFVSGMAALIRLLAPDPRGTAAGSARSP